MHVRNIPTKFDEPDMITGQTGTRKTLERVKDHVVHAVLHENANPTQLIGCAIDLLVVAYILKTRQTMTPPQTRLGRTTVKLRVLGFMARTRGWITVDEVCPVLQDNHTTPSAVQSRAVHAEQRGQVVPGKRGQYA